jgi:arabinan endo-1,5-alpha-L-arabinosidase
LTRQDLTTGEDIVQLITPPGGTCVFRIDLRDDPVLRICVSQERKPPREQRMPDLTHASFLDLYEALADAFGLRWPDARQASPVGTVGEALEPVLVESVSPLILYGYGDPCVVRVGARDYRLLVTSNDAPDAFPILTSEDLRNWRLKGFVFPRGSSPAWALSGADVADFWAPEMHRVGMEWWVCFAARAHDKRLAIGIARSPSPDGPFASDEAPILEGGVIDPHIVADARGSFWLLWKGDDNEVWPDRLSALLHEQPGLVQDLFEQPADRRTAAFVLTLWPWTRSLEPMQRFFAQQPLIEAVASQLDAFAMRLSRRLPGLAPEQARAAGEILARLKTRIYAQKLSPDGRRLEGDPTVILQNDLPWEGHLIEGVWITPEEGRYYLLYAANDFSTPRYAIGAAVADEVTGPYRKTGEVLIGSSHQWWGPGHPSVTVGLDGERRVFLHAFRPGEAGYKAFRALMTTAIRFADGAIHIGSSA